MPSRFASVSTISPPIQPAPVPTQRKHCYYTGRVQGVGFRYTVKNIAMRFDISGYVRNLPDGRVELIVEGPSEEIDQMLHAVDDRMNGYIHKVETNSFPATAEFSHFHIRH